MLRHLCADRVYLVAFDSPPALQVNVCLALADSEKFVVMSRHLPKLDRLATYLTQWDLDEPATESGAFTVVCMRWHGGGGEGAG